MPLKAVELKTALNFSGNQPAFLLCTHTILLPLSRRAEGSLCVHSFGCLLWLMNVYDPLKTTSGLGIELSGTGPYRQVQGPEFVAQYKKGGWGVR